MILTHPQQTELAKVDPFRESIFWNNVENYIRTQNDKIIQDKAKITPPTEKRDNGWNF